MSENYDNWERLVDAVLLRDHLRRICHEDSLSSFSSDYSDSFRSFHESQYSQSNLGLSISHRQISLATNSFSNENLIKRGRSGDLFEGLFRQFPCPAVVKRIVVNRRANFSLELDFLTRIANHSHPRFVPLLGHCLDDENEKFIVYRYLPGKDLSNSLFRKDDYHPDDDSLRSLDWITRWKIARGAAEGLAYLHHECDPPLVHGPVALDQNFEVRLGSLSQVSAERIQKDKFTFTWKSKKPASGTHKTTCAYDVYCFGMVLLELVTGKLGISPSNSADMERMLETTLLNISIYDKETVTKIIDPSLVIDDDFLEEVWGVSIIAKACLNLNPARRPVMKHVVKALENPTKLTRDDEPVMKQQIDKSLENHTKTDDKTVVKEIVKTFVSSTKLTRDDKSVMKQIVKKIEKPMKLTRDAKPISSKTDETRRRRVEGWNNAAFD